MDEYIEVNEVDVVKSEMDEYIEKTIIAMRGGENHEIENQKPKRSEEDKLFDVPSFLAQPKEEVEEHGDRWLTGITEIPLPINTKLRNIEKTEKAKQELFMANKQSSDFGDMKITGNYNSNYTKHQKEWLKKIMAEKESRKRARNIKMGLPEDHGLRKNVSMANRRGVPYATDEQVLDRFVKRYKWR